MNALMRTGNVLLAIGGVFALWGESTLHAHQWTPVKTALPFNQVQTVQASFRADGPGPYRLRIDLNRNLPFERLQPILSGLRDGGTKGSDNPALPGIVWSVREDTGRTISLDGPTGIYEGERVGAVVTRFATVAGHTYIVRADVQRAAPDLQILDPRLAVEYSPIVFKKAYVQAGILSYWFLITTLSGAICLLVGWIRR